MPSLIEQVEKAAEAPFVSETAEQFGVEPVHDPQGPNFSPEDIGRFDRIGMLGRFGAYGGLQATFFVDAPDSKKTIDYEAIERGLDLVEDYRTVVDFMRPSYRDKRIVGTGLGSRDPREMVLIGGVSFFLDPVHDLYRYCLVYRRDSDLIRYGLREDILEAHGPFDRGEHHTPIEKGIVQGIGPVVESLNKGVAKHLIWQDPEAKSATPDAPVLE